MYEKQAGMSARSSLLGSQCNGVVFSVFTEVVFQIRATGAGRVRIRAPGKRAWRGVCLEGEDEQNEIGTGANRAMGQAF